MPSCCKLRNKHIIELRSHLFGTAVMASVIVFQNLFPQFFPSVWLNIFEALDDQFLLIRLCQYMAFLNAGARLPIYSFPKCRGQAGLYPELNKWLYITGKKKKWRNILANSSKLHLHREVNLLNSCVFQFPQPTYALPWWKILMVYYSFSNLVL